MNIYSKLFLLLFIKIFFVASCSDNYDIYKKTDKTKISGNANFFIPITNSTYNFDVIKQIFQDTTLDVKQTSEGYLKYDFDSISIANILVGEDVIPTPFSQNFGINMSNTQKNTFNSLPIGSSLTLPPQTSFLIIEFNTPADIDSIYSLSGNIEMLLTVNFDAKVEVKISCPQIKLRGANNNLEETLVLESISGGSNLQRVSSKYLTTLIQTYFDLSKDQVNTTPTSTPTIRDNVLEIVIETKLIKDKTGIANLPAVPEIRVNMQSSSDFKLNTTYGKFEGLSADNLTNSPKPKSLSFNKAEVPIFKKIKSRIGADAIFEIKGTKLNIKSYNSTGINLSGRLDIFSVTDNGDTVFMKSGSSKGRIINLDRAFLDNGSLLVEPGGKTRNEVFDDLDGDTNTRTNFFELYRIYPDKIHFDYVLSTIEKDKNNTEQFVHNKSRIKYDLIGEVLFNVRLERFYLRDTTKFSIEDNFKTIFESTDSVIIDFTYIVNNSSPINIKATPYFMSESFKIIEPLVSGSVDTSLTLKSVDVDSVGNPKETKTYTSVFSIKMSKNKYNDLISKKSSFLYNEFLIETDKNDDNTSSNFAKLKVKYDFNIIIKANVRSKYEYEL